ncbi:MAG: DUF3320 domain-containing protein, partial [Planctomycetes bacterium]|nr:DUF3320 domain-containing protein [Planctomycetota bacterium]
EAARRLPREVVERERLVLTQEPEHGVFDLDRRQLVDAAHAAGDGARGRWGAVRRRGATHHVRRLPRAGRRRRRQRLAQTFAHTFGDATEAPLTFDRLARTVAAAWGLGRVTERVRERLREALPATVHEVDGVLFADAAQRTTFAGFRVPAADDAGSVRSIDELPAIEIEHAMLWLLRQHQALALDDLARETARCFGITRLGSRVREAMRIVAGRIASGENVRLDGEVLRLL